VNRLKYPYSIYKRPRKKGKPIFYSKFRNPKTGLYEACFSTGCKRRDDAVIWCEEQLSLLQKKQTSISFKEYIDGFWLPNSAYCQEKQSLFDRLGERNRI